MNYDVPEGPAIACGQVGQGYACRFLASDIILQKYRVVQGDELCNPMCRFSSNYFPDGPSGYCHRMIILIKK